MPTPEQIELVQRYLLEDEGALQRSTLSAAQVAHIGRLRMVYLWWKRYPNTPDKKIVALLMREGGVKSSVAYEDLAMLKVCLGALGEQTRAFHQYRLLCMIEETYNLAREKGDAASMTKAISAYGKYTRLDKDELAAPDYAQIVPQSFAPVSDPAAAGLKPIDNLDQRVAALKRKYLAGLALPEDKEA